MNKQSISENIRKYSEFRNPVVYSSPSFWLTAVWLAQWKGTCLSPLWLGLDRYPASTCEMVMRPPSQTDGLPPGALVSSNTKATWTQTSVPTRMIYKNCITKNCLVIVVKKRKALQLGKFFCFKSNILLQLYKHLPL